MPATQFSSEVFPTPDGPTTATHSPAATPKLAPASKRRAGTSSERSSTVSLPTHPSSSGAGGWMDGSVLSNHPTSSHTRSLGYHVTNCRSSVVRPRAAGIPRVVDVLARDVVPNTRIDRPVPASPRRPVLIVDPKEVPRPRPPRHVRGPSIRFPVADHNVPVVVVHVGVIRGPIGSTGPGRAGCRHDKRCRCEGISDPLRTHNSIHFLSVRFLNYEPTLKASDGRITPAGEVACEHRIESTRQLVL